ncbi:MAG: ADP-heptose--lipooligosaccharide heptosyltransferase II [Nitrospira sp.]|nr:MAG: ADP-heptose--lipooligosaccharide heptosyltransferase II [Nitrospira sp.]
MSDERKDMGSETPLQMKPHTIAVVRALQLGDLLCSVPAFRSLRAAFPQAHIALIGLPWSKAFVNRFGRYLDEFIEFPGYPGLPERPPAVAAIPDFLATMQRRRFDLALQMHGNGRYTNQLLSLLGARMTAGFAHPDGHCPDERLFMPYPDHLPEADRHVALLQHLGIPTQGNHLEFPLNRHDVAAFRALQASHGLQPGSYICLHPGGRGSLRRWAPHLFSLVADRLVRAGYRIVITGTEEERPLAEAVMAHMREEATDLVGQTDLGTLAVLLDRSAMLISNDTGVSHVAAALQVPSVIVCIGSDPLRWSPQNTHLHRVLIGQGTTIDDVMGAVHTLERSSSRRHHTRLAAPYRGHALSDLSQAPRQSTESRPSSAFRSL